MSGDERTTSRALNERALAKFEILGVIAAPADPARSA